MRAVQRRRLERSVVGRQRPSRAAQGRLGPRSGRQPLEAQGNAGRATTSGTDRGGAAGRPSGRPRLRRQAGRRAYADKAQLERARKTANRDELERWRVHQARAPTAGQPCSRPGALETASLQRTDAVGAGSSRATPTRSAGQRPRRYCTSRESDPRRAPRFGGLSGGVPGHRRRRLFATRRGRVGGEPAVDVCHLTAYLHQRIHERGVQPRGPLGDEPPPDL